MKRQSDHKVLGSEIIRLAFIIMISGCILTVAISAFATQAGDNRVSESRTYSMISVKSPGLYSTLDAIGVGISNTAYLGNTLQNNDGSPFDLFSPLKNISKTQRGRHESGQR